MKWWSWTILTIIISSLIAFLIEVIPSYMELKSFERELEEVGKAQFERIIECVKNRTKDSEFELLESSCVNGTISFKVKNIGQKPATFGYNIHETTESPEVVKCGSCGFHGGVNCGEIHPNEEGKVNCWRCGSGYHDFEIRFADTINTTVYCE